MAKMPAIVHTVFFSTLIAMMIASSIDIITESAMLPDVRLRRLWLSPGPRHPTRGRKSSIIELTDGYVLGMTGCPAAVFGQRVESIFFKSLAASALITP